MDAMEINRLSKPKLKKLGNFWFLDTEGKLKRLNCLNNAQNVYMEENVIFADDSVFQVDISSNKTVKITKVEEVFDCTNDDDNHFTQTNENDAENSEVCVTTGTIHIESAAHKGTVECLDDNVVNDLTISDVFVERSQNACKNTEGSVDCQNDNVKNDCEPIEYARDALIFTPKEDNPDRGEILEIDKEEYVPDEGSVECPNDNVVNDLDETVSDRSQETGQDACIFKSKEGFVEFPNDTVAHDWDETVSGRSQESGQDACILKSKEESVECPNDTVAHDWDETVLGRSQESGQDACILKSKEGPVECLNDNFVTDRNETVSDGSAESGQDACISNSNEGTVECLNDNFVNDSNETVSDGSAESGQDACISNSNEGSVECPNGTVAHDWDETVSGRSQESGQDACILKSKEGPVECLNDNFVTDRNETVSDGSAESGQDACISNSNEGPVECPNALDHWNDIVWKEPLEKENIVGSAESSDVDSHDTDIDVDLEMGQQEYISEEEDSDVDKQLERGHEDVLLDEEQQYNPNMDEILGMGNEEYVPDKEKQDVEELFEMGHEEYSSSEDSSDADERPKPDNVNGSPLKGVSEVVTMKALFDFEAMFEDEISFRQGDKLDVDKNLLDQASFWFNALHQTSGKKGYIPRSYVTKDDGPLQIHEDKDEKLLHDPSTPTGSYLIRRAKDDALFILSVKLEKETNSEPVKHYKIRYSENKGYYISARRYFDTLPDLIRHYSCVSNGLCCKLENPCLVNPPALPISWLIGPRLYEVTKESVELITKVNQNVSNPFFGEHCLGTFGNEFVGVKTLDDEKTPVKDFLTEALVLKDLRHDKLVRLIALCTQSPPFWIITDTLTKGGLLTYLRQDLGTGLNFDNLLYIASQLELTFFFYQNTKIWNLIR
ncbi:uncharacterized protein LOC123538461 [Mercenaria mercenaria]|uniref:uncharacterized protein LOC123538461 n=1 Tax=Mercenaria mercenaria TaxID=6596 RepID=UPI00234E94C8|nr:uncharacterized protein LOC123538461 [Mercenaria mercenaria]